MVLTPSVLTRNLGYLWRTQMDMNENDKPLPASDLERRVIRIETRLTRFMRHFNLDNEGAPMTQPIQPTNTSATPPLVNEVSDETAAKLLYTLDSLEHGQGANRMCLSTNSEEFADKLRAISTDIFTKPKKATDCDESD